jgi:DNA-binding response OmpR family regulator
MNKSDVKILLVEDDEALRFIVKDNLEQHNYEVEVAENGEIALDAFNRKKFDLILLDVMLPKIDGFQVAKTIRKSDEHIPIIFLTARSMTEDRIAGLTLGPMIIFPNPSAWKNYC